MVPVSTGRPGRDVTRRRDDVRRSGVRRGVGFGRARCRRGLGVRCRGVRGRGVGCARTGRCTLGQDRRLGVRAGLRRGAQPRIGGDRRRQGDRGGEHLLLVDELVVPLLLAHVRQGRADRRELLGGKGGLPLVEVLPRALQPDGDGLGRDEGPRPFGEEHAGDRETRVAGLRAAPAAAAPDTPRAATTNTTAARRSGWPGGSGRPGGAVRRRSARARSRAPSTGTGATRRKVAPRDSLLW